MSFHILDFDRRRLSEAARLLRDAQNRHMAAHGKELLVDERFCEEGIRALLSDEVVSSLMVFDREKVVGYMIATVEDDAIRGKKGWVKLSGWAVAPSYEECLPYLYQRVADAWLSRGVYAHYIIAYDSDSASVDSLINLSFAREQSYALLPLEYYAPGDLSLDAQDLELRQAGIDDRKEIKSFSRIVAEHQTKSPCFASAPSSYLHALDKGFSELPDDEEARIFLAIHRERAWGLELFYESEKDLLNPEGSYELTVGAVKEEYRCRGVARALTAYALGVLKSEGVKYIGTDWRCANLQSRRFWSETGFKATAHRFIRRIDPLIEGGKG